jgi:hypothetical protein
VSSNAARRGPLRALALGAAVVALCAAAGCGDDEEATRPEKAAALPEERKPVFFEPGPVTIEDPPLVDRTLDDLVGLGITAVRVVVFWNTVVPEERPAAFEAADPEDPAYDFSLYDGFVRAADERGLEILVTISGPGPGWTSDSGDGLVNPRPEDFGEFAEAVATRYGGSFNPGGGALPAADYWSVWNEPNLGIFLQPQLVDGVPYSPLLYRKLYLAAQESIEEAVPGAPILIGETAPTGGFDSVDPIPFARAVLCLDEAAVAPACESGEIRAAGWAVHPYGTAGQAPFEAPPSEDFVTVDSLAGIGEVLDEAADAGTAPEELPLYISEYGVQREPDPLIGVPLETQAAYLSIAEQFAYAEPRVESFAQYLMRDDPPDRAPGQLYGGFESGLRFYDGPPKPSYDAFRLPLAVRREGASVHLWGLVRPAREATDVEIRVADGGREKSLRSVTTDEAGIFELESEYRDGRLWQVRWTGPDGETFEGPWTRSYTYEDPFG